MTKQTDCSLSALTLLVHTKIASFEWGKTVIEVFQRHAIRNKLTLRTVYRWQDAADSDVVVLVGVDEPWLKEALKNLDPLRQHIILLNGIADQYHMHISHVLNEQEMLIQDCVELLRRHGRSRPAFFGVQKNDTSDESKALAFAQCVSARDVYYVDADIDACFDELFSRLEYYDSVICANDIMAIYLLGRCRELGISVPERLYLIGNGNLWLGAHVTPTLTTVSYDPDTMAAVTLQLYKNFSRFGKLSAADIHLKGDLIERESTNGISKAHESSEVRSFWQCDDSCDVCAKIYQIRTVDRVLSSCTLEKRTILRMLTEEASYDEIAEQVQLSCDTVKYHIKKMYKALGIHSKEELCDLIRYFGIKLY